MKASVKWVIGAGVLIAVALGLAASLSIFPFENEAEAEPPEPTPTLTDGDYFAFVIVGEDETGAPTLGVDLAEMLTGEEARAAAVEDGVIGEGEDVPNDFYIDNPEKVYESFHLKDGAIFEMISTDDVSQTVTLDIGNFEALYEGSYVGSPVYGVVAGEPVAMDVTISHGLFVGAKAVYLP